MTKSSIWAIHGFLGQPSDWASIAQETCRHDGVEWTSVDLWREDSISPRVPIAEWGTAFNAWVQSPREIRSGEGHREPSRVGPARESRQKRKVLVGYSMGGRLALEAFRQNPDEWDRVFVISSHPGLENSVEKQARREADRVWAERWRACGSEAEFRKVLDDWNRQPVFAGSALEPLRNFADYSMEALSLAMTNWSLAGQEDLRIWLRKNPRRESQICWLVGERDPKYCEILQKLKSEFPGLEARRLEGCGHRAVFDDPDAIAKCLR